ncbi:hypothetical protein N7474_004642 [Penicillium riverlandense]|uniref:uncharacterized protein n=1 Tax=Penicillium riverlandense TaxID=1903569 RepID=UPI00254660C2|nr:uncharacterized protein N7474_004642 [Penicillium riverlandense]KAJ5819051.1 hypothetical protein N7474_004642 [Penicillium riverlandense]
MAQTKKQHRRRKVGRRTARVLKRRSSGPLSDLTNGNLRQGVMPVSLDPLEKNIFERHPLQPGYVFVPKGDVYVTRHCRTRTKEAGQTVYVVWNHAAKRTRGIRVPSEIHHQVRESAAATASSRASAVQVRDAKDLSRARELLQSHFPLMPAPSLETILEHAFLKGSGRVGRTSTTTEERKALLAVEAHIRHTQTPYEKLLEAGMERHDARKAVWETVKSIKTAWAGAGAEEERMPERLALRPAPVIDLMGDSDDDVSLAG